MEVSPAGCFVNNTRRPSGKAFEPNAEVIKQRLIRKGVIPTPKILHILRKKERQKLMRRNKKVALQEGSSPLTEAQMKALEEDTLFFNAASEYRAVMGDLDCKSDQSRTLVGRPWKRPIPVDMLRLGSKGEGFVENQLKSEHLEELRHVLEERSEGVLKWFLNDDDVETIEDARERSRIVDIKWRNSMEEGMGDDEKIQLLCRRLSSANLSIQDWKFTRLMKYSGLLFSELCMLELIEELGARRNWRQAISVVEWVYNQQQYKDCKSRFVHTKLLSVLGKEQRPREAIKIFNEMREDGQIYPDMPAYHSIAVTLGQAGLVEALIHIIECMKQKPSKKLKNMNRKNWDPCLEPDIIVYNAVLNACVSSRQWKGVSWVLQQMRINGLRPTETTYGLAMEVMLKAGKYDLVYKYFEKMRERGLAPKALSYKVLVRSFWEEGKVDEAVATVRDMERRGVVGTPSVYYELACCLCNKGRWLDATMEVEKLKSLPRRKPLEVAFTGMILASLDGGYTEECISIYEYMKDHCNPNIGTINAMLKVYGCSDKFAEAKELFESIKDTCSGTEALADPRMLKPDAYTFASMLETSASACQWEFFEHVYRAMILAGYKLDMSKYSWLLVKASKAGKYHLLEHAFDESLEAGGIPHISIFIEMLCQSIIHLSFEKSAFLLNGMAHASIQMSESQWTRLFQKNKHRLSLDTLQALLTHLRNNCPVSEHPVSDFLRSLELLCGQAVPKQSALAASGRVILTDFREKEGGEYEGYWQEQAISKAVNSVLDQLTDSVDDLSLKLPSAADILQSWKDERIKNGLFLF